MKTVIIHAKIICEEKIQEGMALLIDGSYISAIFPQSELSSYTYDHIIDAEGCYLSAGFIELHTHGIHGYDFMDNYPDKLDQTFYDYARFGVTGVFPTTMSAPFEELEEVLQTFQEHDWTRCEGAQFLGVHLEGPYFSPLQSGAQSAQYMLFPSGGEYRAFLDKFSVIRRWDSAMELEGALEMASELTQRGIVCGLAHTNANASETLTAIQHGCRVATHLYSGMSSVHRINGYRYGGTVEGCLLSDKIYTEAICDGIHLPRELLQLIYKVKGSNRMCLVTDSMRGAAMPEGSSCILGSSRSGIEAVISDGVAWLPDRTAFAGSVATFDRLIRTAVSLADIPLASAIKMGTETPAALMGLSHKGKVKPGFDADLILFDSDIRIMLTMVGGTIFYQNE